MEKIDKARATNKESTASLSPVFIVTNLFMDPITRLKLVAWLKKKVKAGSDHIRNTLKRCKAHLIVEYSCCTKSNILILSPQYATVKVRVG